MAVVLAYYTLLRSILRTQPALRRCRTRCRHCGIYFLTHPRNAGRCDLRCPFGCREAHRRRQSNQRSAAYYRELEGKEKKRAQNAKRRKAPMPPPPPPPAPEPLRPWPAPIVQYVQMVTSLLEGRPVSSAEVAQMLARVLRQHRMVRARRIDQIIAWLHEAPP